jgi:hypothetical protein
MLTAQQVTPVCCNAPYDLSHALTTGYMSASPSRDVSCGSMVYEYDHFTDATTGASNGAFGLSFSLTAPLPLWTKHSLGRLQGS